MMRKLATLAGLLLSLAWAAPTSAADEAACAARFAQLCESAQIPDAELLYRSGNGALTRLRCGVDCPPGLEPRWRIGSISKSFTAVLMLKQQSRGRLDLDSTLADNIPEIGDMFSDARLGSCSLRTMLRHKSGLPYQTGGAENFAWLLPLAGLLLHGARADDEMMLGSVALRPLEFAPGEGFCYSNANYWLAALVMERHTGRKYAELLQDELLGPLELQHTGLLLEPEGTLLMPGHMLFEGVPREITAFDDPAWGSAAGGISTTALDLLAWSDALQDGSFLSTAEAEQLFDFVDVNRGAKGKPYAYSLGLWQRGSGPDRYFGHNGTTPGYRALWRVYPERSETLIILSGQGSSGLDGLAEDMLALLRE